jgi:hypothetical protein
VLAPAQVQALVEQVLDLEHVADASGLAKLLTTP